jgi:uncharacterized protein YdhG (YjbR/CyaY superfamily)
VQFDPNCSVGRPSGQVRPSGAASGPITRPAAAPKTLMRGRGPRSSVAAANPVDEYIRAAPAEVQPILRKVRAAIREAAPDAEETLSYGLPFYSYRGEVGVERRLCYLGVRGTSLVLYLRPKDLEPHAEQIAPYRSTKSALRFPLARSVPIPLIKKLVRDAARRHRGAPEG